MNDWDRLINERFTGKDDTFKMLSETINEVLSEINIIKSLSAPLTEDQGPRTETITWSSIPDIPISEIGWSAMQTRDGVQVPSEQRSQLDQFLSKIAPGADLSVKLDTLTKFYSMDEEVINSFKTGDLKENVGRAISYLVFFKTLTQILTHFNAASAGFSFESFLAVLLGGEQIATGNQTIADLTDSNGIPISLKLYKEKHLEVGGSFTDLVLDIAKDSWNNTMQYVAVTKKFDEGTEGMNQTGTLDWYRFNFNLDNIFNIISKSSKNSRKNILLPKSFMESNGLDIEGIPDKALTMPSDEELETQFLEFLAAEIRNNPDASFIVDGRTLFTVEELKQTINWAKDDRLFTGGKNIERGKSSMVAASTIRNIFQAADHKFAPYANELAPLVKNANNNLILRYKRTAQKKTRQTQVNQIYFYQGVTDEERIEISRKFYEEADAELKKKSLMYTLGYVNNGHFNLTQGMVMKIDALAGPTPGKIFPAGQGQVKIGALQIGASNVMGVLEKLKAILDESIFEIFTNLKTLTTNIQGYFAGGLQEDKKAKVAIGAAENIGTKTAEVAGTGPASKSEPGLSGTPMPGSQARIRTEE